MRNGTNDESWVAAIIVGCAVFVIGMFAFVVGIAVVSAFTPCSDATDAAILIKRLMGGSCP